MLVQTLLLATNNPGKVREFEALLRSLTIHLITPAECGLSLAVAETGTTFAQNASLKAEAFCQASGLASLADDSGLEVDFLDGQPGVYSARYGGDGLTDMDRVGLLLSRLRGVPEEKRSARFISVIALARPGRPIELFTGTVEGRITLLPRGSDGFGYDPIFLYPPAGRSFGEMTLEEKDRVSHRANAARKLIRYLTGDDAGEGKAPDKDGEKR